MVAFLDLDPKN
jgi:hypothetical protein